MTHQEPVAEERVIAIDGPSGTGKSSVAREVARRLVAGYLDTGAMYRAVTLAVLTDGIDPFDGEAVARRAEALVIDITTDPANDRVNVDGADVTEAIRSAEVTAAVSAVSATPAVRRKLIQAQRDLAHAMVTVVEGRDIGTVVFPAARLKIYLTASPSARATRRAHQLGMTEPEQIKALADALRTRDDFDSSRAEGPLRPAQDALVVDSTDLSRDDVVEAILAAVTSRTRSSEVGR